MLLLKYLKYKYERKVNKTQTILLIMKGSIYNNNNKIDKLVMHCALIEAFHRIVITTDFSKFKRLYYLYQISINQFFIYNDHNSLKHLNQDTTNTSLLKLFIFAISIINCILNLIIVFIFKERIKDNNQDNLICYV